MNWKRGLLRLWAVTAVLWVLSVGVIQLTVFGSNYLDFVEFAGLLVIAFIPPLFLLALGYIGLWVGRGFRR
jgi:hypothetical protein